jgi:hypothetical protein
MKQKMRLIILCGLCVVNLNVYSQQSSSGRSSNPKGTTTPQSTGPSNIVRPPMRPTPKINPEEQMPILQKEPEVSFRPVFFQPGILSLRGEGFVGVDHLYNVSGNIPVVVEIEKSANVAVSFSEEKIQQLIEQIFEREGINPIVKPSAGPALPFFQVLIMVIPAGEGFSAFCSGRLFEKVELERVALPQGVYFQAITWEFQNLVFASKEDSEKQIDAAVAEIVQQFLSRYKYYKNITQPR